ncbi:MAG TPA: aldo/keto reductase [Bryobacteraceae bacterium]|jgi:predicted aldo/keto reductase-like oxidoreductase|nr:aldo/keto reductase [Bryobacteraceae bacterium]
MDRREAISTITGLGLALAGQAETISKDMPYRQFGKTSEKVSAVGIGGYHIGVPKDPQIGIRVVRTALDNGINFLDNCWDYNGGESELRMGQALRDGYRQKAFLMTKFDGRTKKAAAQQIDESLRRLQTDHIDLIQFHENIRLEDPDRFFAPGGAHEAMLDAKKAGKVRYFGFTGHKDPSVHLRMLDEAAKNNFHFDACQMPLNPFDAQFRSFQHQVVPVLVKKGIAVLGMKSMGDGLLLKSGVVTPVECLRYALSLPTTTVITGCESMDILNQALHTARTFQPMSDAEQEALLAKSRTPALSGRFELFKTTAVFDGTAANPQWLG